MSVCVSTAYAGRPMLVDDANTNEAGHGHLESWFDKENNALSFSPAYAPIEELELGANFTNSQLTSEKAYSFQMKKLFTSSQQNGCNTGGTLGRSAVTNDSGYSIYGWGILTCNSTNWGSVHANLGWDKVRFPNPVFVGDTLHAETTVLEKRDSKSRPEAGIVIFEHKGFNQRDELIGTCERSALMFRRERG